MQENDETPDDLAARVLELERTVMGLEMKSAALEAKIDALTRREAAGEALHREAIDTDPALPRASRTHADGTRAAVGTDSALLGPRPAQADATSAPAGPATPPRPVTRPTLLLPSTDPGQWVNRLGIALLLFGAAFGFKYSIDRGWIGPALRVISGLGLGAALLTLSRPTREARPGLSRILAGGGLACGYLSIFAAYHLYAMLGEAAAFAAMSVVTAVAFAVSVRDDDATTAIVATIGGLATPFVLDTGGHNVAGNLAYSCVVVATSGAVFARHGWHALLSTTTTGAWLIVAAAVSNGDSHQQAIVQTAIVFVALATWWLAVMRETWSAEDPDGWKPATWGIGDESVTKASPSSPNPDGSHRTDSAAVLSRAPADARGTDGAQPSSRTASESRVGFAPPQGVVGAASESSLFLEPSNSLFFRTGRQASQTAQLALATPVMVLLLSSLNWKLEQADSGWIAVSLAASWGLAALHLRRIPQTIARSLSAMHAVGAVVMLAFATAFLLGDDTRCVGLAAEGLAMLWLSTRTTDRHPVLLGHALFAAAAWLSWFHVLESDWRCGFGSTSFANLAVLVAMGIAARIQKTGPRDLYFLVAQGGLLVWLWRVLGCGDGSSVLVTAAWFTNSIVLVVAGLRSNSSVVRTAGAAVMTLTMAKLFVVDLAQADALWRVITFLVFGAVLLGLGYAFPTLWRRDHDD